MVAVAAPALLSPLSKIEQFASLSLLGNISRLAWWLREADGTDPRAAWARAVLSWRRLRGDGIEIGALHKPLATSAKARVRYVDRFSIAELRCHYPELAKLDVVDPDIVDDGEKLTSIDAGSLDFIIANHFIEHCENPIATIENHLSKLRRRGILYLAVPMRNVTFDKDRLPTSIAHLRKDYERGPEWSRRMHYVDWARNVNGAPEHLVENEADRLMAESYSIHYHVWDYKGFCRLLDYLSRKRGFPFRVANAVWWRFNPSESLFLLEKTL